MKCSDVPSNSSKRSAPTTQSHVAPGATSTSLLERLRADDTESWQRLTRLYGSLVYSWCRQKGLQSEDAADVVQEVFRSVAAAFSSFRRDRPGDSFRRWLKAITTNKIRDHW